MGFGIAVGSTRSVDAVRFEKLYHSGEAFHACALKFVFWIVAAGKVERLEIKKYGAGIGRVAP